MWSPDHPDPAVGAALWAALSPRNDTAAFVARVLDRAEAAGVGTWRAVLGRWSRVAIAAAAVLAVVGGYLAGHARDAATSFDAAWGASPTGGESAVPLPAVHPPPAPG